MKETARFQPYPWQRPQWERLQSAARQQRFPHALLISGVTGIGKAHFAEALAALLCCSSPGELPCGVCKSCVLMSAGTHPDLTRLAPSESGHSIKIDQVRLLLQKVTQSAQYGAKVIILDPAHAMTRGAANALLKILEEPTRDTYFFLLSSDKMALSATIRSRCQAVLLSAHAEDPAVFGLLDAEDPEQARIALRLAEGGPLAALTLLAAAPQRQAFLTSFCDLLAGRLDPIVFSSTCAETPDRALNWLCSCIEDLLKSLSGCDVTTLLHADFTARYREVMTGWDRDRLDSVLEMCYAFKRALLSGVHLNETLQFESIAYRLAQGRRGA